MRARSNHGADRKARGPRVVIETVPFNELPQPAVEAARSVPLAFRSDGRIGNQETARELGRRGGQERARHARILRSLGLVQLAKDHVFYDYEIAGEQFANKQIETLAAMYDGECSEGPSSIIKTAALQLAASRFLYDLGKQNGDPNMLMKASALGNDSRTNIANALELQSREVAARKQLAQSGQGTRLPPWFVQDDEENPTKDES